ncbi:DUF3060 domain-containing protein [Granulibacter bethesdensis]|uniref:beta strand repeat-containing protein n=1 Tax=Granulibacter bethesdensis TaxID=364410 RepID=UPI0012FD20DA|nr:DUF3060 domain-containing protein [Granulibacter bethesdensis]
MKYVKSSSYICKQYHIPLWKQPIVHCVWFRQSSGSFDNISISGSNENIYLGNSNTAGIWGDNNSVSSGKNEKIVLSGKNNNLDSVGPISTVNISGDNFHANASSLVSILVDNNSHGSIYGNNDNISAGSGSSVDISGNKNTIQLGDSSTSRIWGDNETVVGGNKDTVSVAGNNENIYLKNSSIAGIWGNNNTVTAGTDNQLVLSGDGSHLNTIGSGSTVNLIGNNFSASASANVSILVGNNSSGNISATNASISTGSGDTTNISGNNNTIQSGSSNSTNISGNNNNITASSGDTLNITGNSNLLTGSNTTVNIQNSDANNASADTAKGNDQQALLWNTAAQLALRIAAQDPANRTDLTTRIKVGDHVTDVTVYANPDLSMIGAGNKFHDIGTNAWDIVELVGVAAINIAAIAFPVVMPAAIAVDLAEAGKEFSNGNVLGGFLNLATAAAGGLGAYADGLGSATGISSETFKGASNVIYTASQAVGGVYGAVQGAENGDAGGTLGSILMSAATIASGTSLASSDASSQAFYAKIASGLNMLSAGTSLSTAFANGEITTGLVQSLSLVLTNMANNYANYRAASQYALQVAQITPGMLGRPEHIPFVGGAGDSSISGLIKGYEDHYQHYHPNADVKYFTWDQSLELAAWAKNSGGTATIIAHSYGGSTAASVVASGIHVNTLVTIDPVGYYTPDFTKITENSQKWYDFNSSNSGINIPNVIAGVGGGLE